MRLTSLPAYSQQHQSWSATTPAHLHSNAFSRQNISEAETWPSEPSIESTPKQEACGSFPGDLRRPAACLDYSRCPEDNAGFPILCRPAATRSPMPDTSSIAGPSSQQPPANPLQNLEPTPSERHQLLRDPSGANEPASTIATTATTATTAPPAPTPIRPTQSRGAPSRSRRDFAPSKPGQRVPHNLIERRYRDNLNAQIEELRSNLPTLRDAYSCNNDVEDCVVPPRIPSKAVVISSASDYIKQLESEQARLLERNQALVEQVEGLQRLVKCDDCSVLKYLSSLSVEAQTQGQP